MSSLHALQFFWLMCSGALAASSFLPQWSCAGFIFGNEGEIPPDDVVVACMTPEREFMIVLEQNPWSSHNRAVFDTKKRAEQGRMGKRRLSSFQEQRRITRSGVRS